MHPTRNVFWTVELSFIAGVLGSYLQGVSKDAFAIRNEVAHYIDRCMAAGFCKTEDDIRACAGRYLGSSTYSYPQRQMDALIKHLQDYVDNFKEELLTPVHTWKTQSRFKQPPKKKVGKLHPILAGFTKQGKR